MSVIILSVLGLLLIFEDTMYILFTKGGVFYFHLYHSDLLLGYEHLSR